MSLQDTLNFVRQAFVPYCDLTIQVWRTPDNSTQSYASGYGDTDVINHPLSGNNPATGAPWVLDSLGKALFATYIGRITAPKANRASEEDVSNQIEDTKVRITVELPWNTTVRHDDEIYVIYPGPTVNALGQTIPPYFDQFPNGVTKRYSIEIYNPHSWALSQHLMCAEIGVIEGE